MKNTLFPATIFLLAITAACQTRHAVEVAPVKVEPIHITIDVNVRIDEALDSFFDDLDEAEQQIDGSPSSEQANN